MLPPKAFAPFSLLHLLTAMDGVLQVSRVICIKVGSIRGIF
jgi:hypothetical protein